MAKTHRFRRACDEKAPLDVPAFLIETGNIERSERRDRFKTASLHLRPAPMTAKTHSSFDIRMPTLLREKIKYEVRNMNYAVKLLLVPFS